MECTLLGLPYLCSEPDCSSSRGGVVVMYLGVGCSGRSDGLDGRGGTWCGRCSAIRVRRIDAAD